MTSIPSAIINLEAFDESINCLIIAESGWGKTVLAGTADRRKTDGPKALFLATENGTISAARQNSTADLWPIRRWSDLIEAYSFMATGGGCDAYQWLLLDSITEMQKLSMDNALTTAVASNKGRDPDVPAIQDYMKVQQQTLNMLRRFNELPINCMYTALPLRLEDEDGNPYFLPALDGKQGGIAQQAMGYMHVVGHGVKRNVKQPDDKTIMVRRVYFQSNGPYKAKDRYGVLGRFMDNPTVGEIEERINKDRPKDAMRSKPAPVDIRVSGSSTTPAPPAALPHESDEVVDVEVVSDGAEY
jgi:AAA domain